jgi:hypothetical protein
MKALTFKNAGFEWEKRKRSVLRDDEFFAKLLNPNTTRSNPTYPATPVLVPHNQPFETIPTSSYPYPRVPTFVATDPRIMEQQQRTTSTITNLTHQHTEFINNYSHTTNSNSSDPFDHAMQGMNPAPQAAKAY